MSEHPTIEELEAAVERELHLIETAIGFALAEKNIPREPQWTTLTPAGIERALAALSDLAARARDVERDLARCHDAYMSLSEPGIR